MSCCGGIGTFFCGDSTKTDHQERCLRAAVINAALVAIAAATVGVLGFCGVIAMSNPVAIALVAGGAGVLIYMVFSLALAMRKEAGWNYYQN